MRDKYIFIFALVCALSFGTAEMSAQKLSTNRTKWLQEVREYKHEQLAKATEMTQAQINEFFPLYTEMEKEVYQVNVDARALERKITKAGSAEVSEAEYDRAARALAEVKLREAQIEMGYYAKFEKILSKKQLFLLQRAENRFAVDMLKHNKRGQASKNKQ